MRYGSVFVVLICVFFSIGFIERYWQWTGYASGPEYGKAIDIAEGKIPLFLFGGKVFNSIGGWYHSGVSNITCDNWI